MFTARDQPKVPKAKRQSLYSKAKEKTKKALGFGFKLGVQEAIPVASNVQPDWVLVVRDEQSQQALDLLNKFKGLDKKTLSIFTQEQSQKQEFLDFFDIPVVNRPFEVNIFYRHHLNPAKPEYYSIEEFDEKMQLARHDELIEITRCGLSHQKH